MARPKRLSDIGRVDERLLQWVVHCSCSPVWLCRCRYEPDAKWITEAHAAMGEGHVAHYKRERVSGPV